MKRRLQLLAMAAATVSVSGFALALAEQPIPAIPAATVSAPVTPIATIPYEQALTPLADLVASVESHNAGGYNAANAGWAGDLGANGLRKHFGRDSSEVSVGQVINAQRNGWLFAVGRYQMIPRTLAFAVSHSPEINSQTMFNAETQDTLFLALVKHKRPAVWDYLQGRGSKSSAIHALALEWAGLPGHHGYTLYGNGNAAHTNLIRVNQVLDETRANFLDL